MFAVFSNDHFEKIIKDEELPFWQSTNDQKLFCYRINEQQLNETLLAYDIEVADMYNYFDFIINVQGSLIIVPNPNLINKIAAKKMDETQKDTFNFTESLIAQAKSEMRYHMLTIIKNKLNDLSFLDRIKLLFLKKEFLIE